MVFLQFCVWFSLNPQIPQVPISTRPLTIRLPGPSSAANFSSAYLSRPPMTYLRRYRRGEPFLSRCFFRSSVANIYWSLASEDGLELVSGNCSLEGAELLGEGDWIVAGPDIGLVSAVSCNASSPASLITLSISSKGSLDGVFGVFADGFISPPKGDSRMLRDDASIKKQRDTERIWINVILVNLALALLSFWIKDRGVAWGPITFARASLGLLRLQLFRATCWEFLGCWPSAERRTAESGELLADAVVKGVPVFKLVSAIAYRQIKPCGQVTLATRYQENGLRRPSSSCDGLRAHR